MPDDPQSTGEYAAVDRLCIVDLFAGPGGWSEGLRILSPELHACELGVELDTDALATRAAAGHASAPWDVRDFDPGAYEDIPMGLIASPPCQPFSVSNRKRVDLREQELVQQVLQWVDVARPRWVACEQVPPVLPIWEEYAAKFRTWGYSAWTGYLHAEEFGVPQTRKRAFLLASLDREVTPPKPTHQRYQPRVPQGAVDGVLPWVTAKQALGDGDWHDTPSPTVACDPRLAPRGCKHPRPGCCSKWSGTPGLQFGPGTVRVTPAQAGVLQSFPADYPWQGKRGSQFQQVGNAVPPLLAAHVLGAVTGCEQPTSSVSLIAGRPDA